MSGPRTSFAVDRGEPTASCLNRLGYVLVSPRIIVFRFIPTSVVSEPIASVLGPLVAEPFARLPRNARLGLGWLALLAIIFGSAFGFPLSEVSSHYIRCTIWLVI